jgi:deoxyadenosine/deoxycytidine kinase
MNFYKELFNNVKLKKGFGVELNIAGVVGVGKSSLSAILEEKGYVIYREPVFDNPLLDKFYFNKERFAFPLQIFFLNKRFQMIKDATKMDKSVLDRSILEDTIFAKMLRDRGEMVPEEYDIYIELFYNMLEHVKSPRLMVYLRVQPEEAIRRINLRGRDYEVENDESYWHQLNDNYEEYFKNYNWSPLLTIDVDEIDFVNNEQDKEFVLRQIFKKLSVLYPHLYRYDVSDNSVFRLNPEFDDNIQKII